MSQLVRNEMGHNGHIDLGFYEAIQDILITCLE